LGAVVALVFCLLLVGGVLVYFAHEAALLHQSADNIQTAIREAHKKSDLLAERRMAELRKALNISPKKPKGPSGPAATTVDPNRLGEFLSKALGQYGDLLGAGQEPEDVNKFLDQLNATLNGADKAHRKGKSAPAQSEKP